MDIPESTRQRLQGVGDHTDPEDDPHCQQTREVGSFPEQQLGGYNRRSNFHGVSFEIRDLYRPHSNDGSGNAVANVGVSEN